MYDMCNNKGMSTCTASTEERVSSFAMVVGLCEVCVRGCVFECVIGA